ncbi:MAG TPA: LptF/LptG family permease [Ignavibacteriales bacterium]|nr:LptF/LptG family permease [Ignavibacteriales bacterium]
MLKLKIFDKYVLKQFIYTFLFSLLAFLLLFIVIDLMENLDDFVDAKMNVKLVFLYYIYFIPDMIKFMTPVSALLSALFTTGKLSNLNELVVIRAAGVSLFRYLIPFLLTAIFISLFQVYFTGYVIPKANKNKIFIERRYMNKKKVFADENIIFQDTKYKIVSIGYYIVDEKTAYKVTITEFDKDDITSVVKRLDAEAMTYDANSHSWKLESIKQREFTGEKVIIDDIPSLTINDLHFTPDDIIKSNITYDEMNNKELQNRINDEIQAGLDPRRTITEYHSRLAFSFATVIVVFFGVPLSVNKRKGGLAVQFGVNVLVAFVYLALMKISQAVGKNGGINPIITAWFANIFFLLVAIVNFLKSDR